MCQMLFSHKTENEEMENEFSENFLPSFVDVVSDEEKNLSQPRVVPFLGSSIKELLM